MKKTSKKKKRILFLCLLIFSMIEIPVGLLKTKISLVFAKVDSITMNLIAFPDLKYICADSGTQIFMDVSLMNSNHEPVPFSLITVKLNNFSGKIHPRHPVTNKDGRVAIRILPDSMQIENAYQEEEKPLEIDISVTLQSWKSQTIKWNGKLSPPPVLLVHGFQDTSESMIPLKNYLESKGLRAYAIDYPTDTDMDSMSEALDLSLKQIKDALRKENVYMSKADIVAHSLGGLLVRYFSTNESFPEKNNIRKIIFINVPHHGTPWAEAGAAFLNTPFLRQLYPTGELFTTTFPSSINKGLNHNIQVANIALENDEVVPLESSMLDSWDVKTRIYRIGSEPLSLESIISSQTSGTSVHRQILFFVPVFEDILQYLTTDQIFPRKKR